jgi:hypothetical protein
MRRTDQGITHSPFQSKLHDARREKHYLEQLGHLQVTAGALDKANVVPGGRAAFNICAGNCDELKTDLTK